MITMALMILLLCSLLQAHTSIASNLQVPAPTNEPSKATSAGSSGTALHGSQTGFFLVNIPSRGLPYLLSTQPTMSVPASLAIASTNSSSPTFVPSLGIKYGTQIIGPLSSNVPSEISGSRYIPSAFGTPVHPAWNFNWKSPMLASQYPPRSNPTASSATNISPQLQNSSLNQRITNVALTPSGASISSETVRYPMIPGKPSELAFTAETSQALQSSPSFSRSMASYPATPSFRSAINNKDPNSLQDLPPGSLSIPTALPTMSTFVTESGDWVASRSEQPMITGPFQPSSSLSISYVTSTALDPIGAMASSSARAVQSSIATLIPIVQHYIDNPGDDTSKNAVNAINGVLPIAKVYLSSSFIISRTRSVIY